MAAAWAVDLPHDLPAVLTCHNLTWRWYESRARRALGCPRGRSSRAEAARYRRHVLRALPRFDTAVAVSTLEAEELRALGVHAGGADPDRGRHATLLRPGARAARAAAAAVHRAR